MPNTTRLQSWPRPENDNGLGIHGGLDKTPEAIARDVQLVKGLGLKWVLSTHGDEMQMQRSAEEYLAEGIVPAHRPMTAIDVYYPFARDAQVLINMGAPPYLQIHNEPTDPREWVGSVNLPRFYRSWVDRAVEVANVGGYPGLQVLHPEDLRAVIAEIRRKGVEYIFERMWFCPHNYGLNHPPDYPYDAAAQEGTPVTPEEYSKYEWRGTREQVNEWRRDAKRPGATVHEDYWCSLGFLAFAKIFEEEVGFVPPFICGEGGWIYGALEDGRYPKAQDELHAQYTVEMFSWFKDRALSNGDPLPDYLFAVCPWILSDASFEAWYGWTIKEKTIEAVKAIPSFVRKFSWDLTWSHFVMYSPFMASNWLEALQPYLDAFQPDHGMGLWDALTIKTPEHHLTFVGSGSSRYGISQAREEAIREQLPQIITDRMEANNVTELGAEVQRRIEDDLRYG
jgi:hypothetical protein